MPAHDPDVQRPIFIAGAGRSGTTLLRSLLSAHSSIAITPETHYMKRAEKWGFPEHEGPLDFDRFWERYVASVRFRDLDIDPDDCRARIERAERVTFRTVFAAVLEAYLERMGKGRIGEKTPGHVHFIPHLLAWFPDARIVILRRDPRAVVASQMRSPWVAERLSSPSLRSGLVVGSYLHQVAYYAEDWASMYERIVPASLSDPRVLVVAYEALVQDAEQELRRVCAFLEEPFEPSMLHRRSDETVPPPASTTDLKDTMWRDWRQEHHAKTLQPISTTSLDKWKGHLTEREVAMVEGRCEDGMRAAGYALTTPPLHRRAGRSAVEVLLTLERGESGIRDGTRTFTKRGRRLGRKLLNALR